MRCIRAQSYLKIVSNHGVDVASILSKELFTLGFTAACEVHAPYEAVRHLLSAAPVGPPGLRLPRGTCGNIASRLCRLYKYARVTTQPSSYHSATACPHAVQVLYIATNNRRHARAHLRTFLRPSRRNHGTLNACRTELSHA